MTRDDAIVVTTKVQAPPPRRHHVSRARLLERMTGARTVLVTAPAGYGKTSLLAEWCEQRAADGPVAWLTLDRADSDPARFYPYLRAALERANPPAFEGLVPDAQSAYERPTDSLLPRLVNAVQAVPVPVVLVLDGVDVVSDVVVDGLRWLLDHQPANLSVGMAGRSEPNLPTHRLRVADEFVELKALDLAFTEEETGALFEQRFDLQLPGYAIATIHSRTEGWPAALCLAAQSVSAAGDMPRFVESFAADDRNVVDYLAEEVFDRVDPAMRDFLLRTSILERMVGPLCDHVVESSDASETLARLEGENVLIQPLDRRRDWYRYHPLFADWLRTELRRAAPGEEGVLRSRAARWLAENELYEEAIDQAIEAGDHALASALLKRVGIAFYDRGRRATLIKWIESLPEGTPGDTPELLVMIGYSMVVEGRLEEGRQWAERGRQTLDVAESGDLSERLRVDLNWIDAVDRYLRGDMRAGLEAAERAVESMEALRHRGVAPTGALPVTEAEANWMFILWANDELAVAASAADDIIDGYEEGSPVNPLILAAGIRAFIHMDLGETEEALDLAARAIRFGDDHYLSDQIEELPSFLVQMMVGDEDVSAAAARRAQRAAARLPLGRFYFCLAEAVRAGRDDRLDLASALVEDAGAIIANWAQPGITARHLSEARVRLAKGLTSMGADPSTLTDREITVLRALSGPLTSREIARELYLSVNTVKTHTRQAYRKLGVSSRKEAVRRAKQLGVI